MVKLTTVKPMIMETTLENTMLKHRVLKQLLFHGQEIPVPGLCL